MKKFAKMSLVAAVAVAGLTGTASAADLSEAIKGVDVSGQFRLRYEDTASDVDGTKTTNENSSDVEVEVTAKVPVNDNVTAVFKIDNANNDADDVNVSTDNDVNIEDYYFQYVNGAVTVNFGQQNIPGRFHFAKQGDGLVALYNAEAFTVGAAAFITNNVTAAAAMQQRDVASILAAGNIGPVALSAQYFDVADYLDGYNVKADATVGPVTAGVEYTEYELDGATTEEYETLEAYVSGSIEAVSAKVTYASTGKDGSGSIDANAEAPAELLLYQLSTAGRFDASVVAVDVSYALTDAISLRAAYADGDDKATVGGTKRDLSETLGQISYKMSSNLNTYFRISELETKVNGGTKTEKVRGRIEVAYTF